MLISSDQLSGQDAEEPVPTAGEQLASEVQDGDGNVLYRAIYDLEAPPAPKGLLAAGDVGLMASNMSEEWFDDDFKADQAETSMMMAQPLMAKGGSGGIEAAKLAWDIIKASKPITNLQQASTALLNAADPNPMNYPGAKTGQSTKYYWWGYNYPFKKWKCFEVWLEVAGTYHAAAPSNLAPGHYVPSLYINFPKNPWTGFGYTMTGTVQITSPSNVGSAHNVTVYSEVIASVAVTSIVDNMSQNFRFSANGKTGFKKGR
ncbi:MAG: hypothetical protein AAGF13_01165 [Pseudomonadota bacterium]